MQLLQRLHWSNVQWYLESYGEMKIIAWVATFQRLGGGGGGEERDELRREPYRFLAHTVFAISSA